MSSNKLEEMIDLIKNNLAHNGFPEKRVSLPLEKLYEVADEKEINFNSALELLETNHNISHEKSLDKIVFTSNEKKLFDNVDMNSFKGMDQQDFTSKVSDMINNMSPEETNKIQEMYNNLSAEEKENILKKGQEMGLL